MSDVKTMYFPDCGGGSDNRLLETAMLANGGMGMCGGGFIWPFLLLGILGRNGLFGNNYGENNPQLAAIQAQLNTNQGNVLTMDAIKGNGNSIHELAGIVGCNHNAIVAAINTLQSAICNVSNSVGYNAMQTINAINAGNASLANQLSSCCCDIREGVTKMGYDNQLATLNQTNQLDRAIDRVNDTVVKGICDSAYATQQQTNALAQNNDANTRSILAKLDAIEDSRKDREIATLTAQLTAANSRAERQAELAPIYKALADIQCKQPQTVTLPYSCATAIPTNVAWQLGAYAANGFGLNGGQGGGFL